MDQHSYMPNIDIHDSAYAAIFPNLPDRLVGLAVLAENLWWSWRPRARMLFKMLDRQAWKESGHNPDKMLREMPPEILNAASADPDYLRYYDVVLAVFQKYMNRKDCQVMEMSVEDSVAVAYFSAEYGLHRSLPFYAGGLGFLAGDFIKECSDLNLPVVAVGFMYPEGYLHQKIREDGWQENTEERFDRDAAAISRVLNATGQQLIVQVPVIEPVIHVAVWKVAVGRISLFLLDTDIEQNDPWNRMMSARLYTGDLDNRLKQEIVLGIGGAKVLATLGINYEIMHLNEGHAAFATLERIRHRTNGGENFTEAFEKVRRSTVFTTHTPVPAGHDVFPFHMVDKYFHNYWPALGIEREQFYRLGAGPSSSQTGFNMTAFALRASQFKNAVSARHAEITGHMWPRCMSDSEAEKKRFVHVTNGVHLPTWLEPKLKMLFDRYLGAGWMDDHDNPVVWEMIDKIPDQELWHAHYWLKIKLIDAIRERSRLRWVKDRPGPSSILAGGALLDPSVLTIGFARRFATYKRANLILKDLQRLKRLLNDRWRPIQIIFAGKAHPADDPGKMILQEIFNACRSADMGGHIAFVEDYGEQLAQYLVHGTDLWLNNPLPPMEACGTSGMKAALNGVPQLSILDGWWIEGFNGQNGWAIEHQERESDRDGPDAEAIYRILEDNIIPLYYRTSDDGIPVGWVKLMKATIKASAARFSARRMVKDYVEKLYAPALEQSLPVRPRKSNHGTFQS